MNSLQILKYLKFQFQIESVKPAASFHIANSESQCQSPAKAELRMRRCHHCTQFGDICKCAEDTLNQTGHIIDGDTEQCWFQYRPLRDTTCHLSPSRHCVIDPYMVI